MAMTDPIADMLTRIRNANSVYHESVAIPGSKVKTAIAEVLKKGRLHQGLLLPGGRQAGRSHRHAEVWSQA